VQWRLWWSIAIWENFESVFDYNICMRFHYQLYFQFEIVFHCNSFYIILGHCPKRWPINIDALLLFRICRKSAEGAWSLVSLLHRVRFEMWSRVLYMIHRVDLSSGIRAIPHCVFIVIRRQYPVYCNPQAISSAFIAIRRQYPYFAYYSLFGSFA